MKRIIAIGVVFTLTLVASLSFASEASLTCDNIVFSKDRTAANYSGNVVVSFEKSTKMTIKSNYMRRNGNEIVLEGDVEIGHDTFRIETEKATIITEDGKITIKMDSARSSHI